jgi:hypothetical protein
VWRRPNCTSLGCNLRCSISTSHGIFLVIGCDTSVDTDTDTDTGAGHGFSYSSNSSCIYHYAPQAAIQGC